MLFMVKRYQEKAEGKEKLWLDSFLSNFSYISNFISCFIYLASALRS